MKLSLVPRETKFFDLFEKAADNLVEGAKLLIDLTENYENVSEKAKQIKQVEHNGDLITHEIVEKLNRTFITPFDREDILQLTSGLDDVLDSIEALAYRLVMFKIRKPTEQMRELVRILVKASEQIREAVYSLRNLQKIMTFCIEINSLENRADDISREALTNLFDEEKDPVEIIKWKEIYGRLEVTTDECEDIANTIESIVVKNA